MEKYYQTWCLPKLQNMGKDHLKANSTSKKTAKIKRSIRQEPPQSGLLKINFDGSVVDSKAAAGFIIRNEDGTLIIAGCRCLGENMISTAVGTALKDAFWMAKIRSFKVRVAIKNHYQRYSVVGDFF